MVYTFQGQCHQIYMKANGSTMCIKLCDIKLQIRISSFLLHLMLFNFSWAMKKTEGSFYVLYKYFIIKTKHLTICPNETPNVAHISYLVFPVLIGMFKILSKGRRKWNITFTFAILPSGGKYKLQSFYLQFTVAKKLMDARCGGTCQ